MNSRIESDIDEAFSVFRAGLSERVGVIEGARAILGGFFLPQIVELPFLSRMTKILVCNESRQEISAGGRITPVSGALEKAVKALPDRTISLIGSFWSAKPPLDKESATHLHRILRDGGVLAALLPGGTLPPEMLRFMKRACGESGRSLNLRDDPERPGHRERGIRKGLESAGFTSVRIWGDSSAIRPARVSDTLDIVRLLGGTDLPGGVPADVFGRLSAILERELADRGRIELTYTCVGVIAEK
ncbi:MAG: hypothetical protein A2Z34_01745 [Planctomycetes bacterium RBG_16_59_8]|nr:MAG: hypothetical protein A2Z34_01745 [Planctomycetes bacterium RBG_16_59_8]